MASSRTFWQVLWALLFGMAICLPAQAFEDVNMNTTLAVQDGQLVAHWSTRGFDHYNIRWSAYGGPPAQLGRDGDKDFVFITKYVPGATYKVAVQGCETHALSRSQCTSWDEASCGEARNPCAGPMPRAIKSGGGLCLEVRASDQRMNGGKVQLWHCNNADQQTWTLHGSAIVSLGGKCLDVHAPNMQKNGGHVQIWDCNGSIQQKWYKQGMQIRSGGGKCLDAAAPDLYKDGAYIQVWDCNGAKQQQWYQTNSF